MKSHKTATAFGAVLRELRKQQSLSQEKLAFESGLDRTYISLLEVGQRSPSLETMLALSRALRIPLAYLSSLVEARLVESNDDRRNAS
ncbi:helix-turn-helix domain-containing protein [Cupriavidus pauculus]|uniref:helix-turn-helix domain-containing protein n=1 Tax=Burkholderiaceae TaxID=119060 RepID=UPI000492F0C3|nr:MULTISPECIES: helix-turn-helix transcriptional regulator [Burkholderiaceae]MCM3609115.1 helix-turn-helix domain-containing protein [Cupriavidus pauculus]